MPDPRIFAHPSLGLYIGMKWLQVSNLPFQPAGVASSNSRIFHALRSDQCWFDCLFDQSDAKYFSMYSIKFEFLYFSSGSHSSRHWFLMFLLYSKGLGCFNAVLFRLSCWTTWPWPEGTLNEWYSNELIQWVVLLEISCTPPASSLCCHCCATAPVVTIFWWQLIVRSAYISCVRLHPNILMRCMG